MEQLSIGDGEMLALHVREMVRNIGAPAGHRPPQPARQQQRGQPDPETVRLQLLGNPVARQQVESQRPELGAVIDDPHRFAQVWQRMMDDDLAAQNQRNQEIADLNADPFDVDAQMRIAEMIRQERVQENLQEAIEHTPEGTKPFYMREEVLC